jgi:hypothetical protein
MFRRTRLFRSNLLALVLFSLALVTAACDGKKPTEEDNAGDYCSQYPENC